MKRVNMKNLLFILITFCGIVWGKELSLPTLPLSDYIDTEVSTNIVVGSALQNFRELNVGVITNQGLANLVEVSFGKDISSECTVTYYYREDLSHDQVQVDKVDETKGGMYYAVYSAPASRYKTVTLIRNIYVTGVEE